MSCDYCWPGNCCGGPNCLVGPVTTPPRIFTNAELCTVTTSQLAAFDHDTRAAFERAYWNAISEPPVSLAQYVAGDDDLVDTNRRFELGE